MFDFFDKHNVCNVFFSSGAFLRKVKPFAIDISLRNYYNTKSATM